MSPLDSIKWIKRFEKLSYTAKEKWPSDINKRTYINSQSDTISHPSTDQKKNGSSNTKDGETGPSLLQSNWMSSGKFTDAVNI